MSKIEFILSVLVSICAAIMLVNVFIVPSSMKEFAIIVFLIIFAMSLVLVGLTYKEMIKDCKEE